MGAKELHQGRYCTCSMGAQTIPCAQWETEASNDGFALSCDVSAATRTPATSSYASFTFKGRLGDASGTHKAEPGLARFKVALATKKVAIDHSSNAIRYTFPSGLWKGQDIVEITAYGSVTPLSKTRYTMSMLKVRYTVSLLQKLQRGEAVPGEPQTGFHVTLYKAEQVSQGSDSYSRVCPAAVSTDKQIGQLAACAKGEPRVGEVIEVAGSVPLFDDQESLQTWLGTTSCFCYRNSSAIDCSSLPKE